MSLSSNKKKKIFLTGMMGSGKTVTGKELATMFKMPFVDLDDVIEQSEGSSITDIFKQRGEVNFRNIELNCLEKSIAQESFVMATGGGIILAEKNIRSMKDAGIVVYLATSLESLWSRVSQASHRPLLSKENPKEALKKIYEQRRSIYESSADLEVLTDGLGAKDVALKINALLENKFA